MKAFGLCAEPHTELDGGRDPAFSAFSVTLAFHSHPSEDLYLRDLVLSKKSKDGFTDQSVRCLLCTSTLYIYFIVLQMKHYFIPVNPREDRDSL